MKNPHTSRRLPSVLRRSTTALVLATLLAGWQAQADERNALPRLIVGNWYVALDAGPFDPNLAGTFLSGLAHFHADRTFMLSDAGDFAAESFPMSTLSSAQFGAWAVTDVTARGVAGIAGTSLYLDADAETGEAIGWSKVQFLLHIVDRNTVEGVINTYFLPCEVLPPLPTPLTCPDPVANAAAFAPSSPPDVPITLTRIAAVD